MPVSAQLKRPIAAQVRYTRRFVVHRQRRALPPLGATAEQFDQARREHQAKQEPAHKKHHCGRRSVNDAAQIQTLRHASIDGRRNNVFAKKKSNEAGLQRLSGDANDQTRTSNSSISH